MNKREIKVGTRVRHFKGNKYKVLGFVDHVDNGRLVIYQSVLDASVIWARDYEEFLSEVDRLKYPNCEQKYRFEVIA